MSVPVRIKNIKHNEDVKKIEEAADHEELYDFQPPEGNWNFVRSTGSTLLDLAISGTKIKGGGIPGSIILEVFGPPSIGKTSVLAEIIASVLSNGGEAYILDPEARMDKQYLKVYGVKLTDKNYSRPNEVKSIFEIIDKATPSAKDNVNVVAADSLAAFCSAMEMEGDDKRGQARAKEFSTGFRKVATTIAEKNLIVACSNQIRQADFGATTPGGMAVPFYASLRIQMFPTKGGNISREKTVHGDKNDPDSLDGKFSQDIGVITKCKIVKSSLDVPHREANIIITFNYGIDDLRANLQWNKEVTGNDRYICTDGKDYAYLNDAIRYCEDHNLENYVKERTIKLWYKIRQELHIPRKPKQR